MLLRMLGDAGSFRVRARAALALSRLETPEVVLALEGALEDRHAAVRAAAATALGHNGGRRSVPALRLAASDRTSTVAAAAKAALRSIAERHTAQPAGPALAARVARGSRDPVARVRGVAHVVVLGEMHDRTPSRSKVLAAQLGEYIAAALGKLDRVAVLRSDELDAAMRLEIARRRLNTVRIEGNLQHVQPVFTDSERRVRCEVSLLVLDENSGALRGMLRGAASAVAVRSGPATAQERDLAQKALRSAVQTALSTALSAISGAKSEPDLQGSESAALTPKPTPASPVAR